MEVREALLKRRSVRKFTEKIVSDEMIEELLHAENVIPLFSKKERCRQILGELLFALEPIKTYVFTSRFNISERTLYGDLDALDVWFSDYQIQIVRRTGLGIFLEGHEANIRQAIANAVFEFCDTDQLPGLIMDFENNMEENVSFKKSIPWCYERSFYNQRCYRRS